MTIKTILFVDDDESIRTVISIALEQYGYEVYTASDAVSTFSILKEHQIDLIIMDHGLRGIDGVELGAEILKQSPGSNQPIVLFTGTRDRELALQAKSVGFVDCWIKPMGLKVIRQKIESLGL